MPTLEEAAASTNLEGLKFNITSTVLSSDDSGTQIVESLLMDNALATVALAEQQARTADALELGNMIAARHMGIFRSAEEYAAVESKIRGLLGLEGPNA